MVVIKFIAFIIMIYGVIGYILTFIPFEKRDDNGRRTGQSFKRVLPMYKMAIILGAFTFFLSLTVVQIGAQDTGVVVTPSGVRNEELHTGWHFIMPWNDIHLMDKTMWVYTCANSQDEGQRADADAIWAPTKDGIKMGFDVSVSWRIIPEEASWIYANVTENDGGNSGRYLWLEENVIRPKLKSALALSVSNYNPIEVYSVMREEIQNGVMERMRNEVKGFKLVIVQVDLREVYYNPEYELAINAKKLAEQEALRLFEVTKQKEEQLKQAEIEKNIAIQKAEGEAKALEIKGTSIAANPKIIQLEWINKWNGQLPTYMMGEGNGVILDLGKQ
ncbi:MAG: prohibitin family protein [Flavobacteriales bacterium]|nr:prohibitin family protein [Flavobacteriales bacterium]